ncbi:MAG: hypothetical protein OXB88_09535 [Bacteriovoracales bacterium]|nr:hypothetical protein [Bacteriovoracales bacterium]
MIVNVLKVALLFLLGLFARRILRRFLAMKRMEGAPGKKGPSKDDPHTVEAEFDRL